MTGHRRRDESGAAALIIVTLAVVLFTMAALSVDLGDAWARKRAVQKQVDLAALSAGHLLPATSLASSQEIARAVAASVNQAGDPSQPDNHVTGQSSVAYTAADFLDADPANGNIAFQHDDGGSCNPAVGDTCTQMRVTAPQATITFGFAQVVGAKSTVVSQDAVVRVMSGQPRKGDTLPFWLPNGCAYGPADADTSQGGGSGGSAAAPAPTPTPTPASSPAPAPTTTASAGTAPAASSAPQVTIAPVGGHRLGGSALSTAAGSTKTVTGYTVSSVPANTDRASIRFVAPDGTYFIDFAVNESKPKGTLYVPSFQVGPSVTGIPGTWTVYALIQGNGGKVVEYSSTSLAFTVTGSAPTTPTPTPTPTPSTPAPSTSPTSPTASPSASGVPVGCVGQDRGNFGQLQSPRRDVGNIQQALGPNIADGVDHQLVQFTSTPALSCGSGSSLLAGAQLDDGPPRDGRNCIVGDTGNDGPALLDGLVTGTSSPAFLGRLDTGRPDGRTTCPGRSDLSVKGHQINNDVLSCFLRNGASLATISQQSGVPEGVLDPAVLRSPRFVWLPVVYANDRSVKTFQPIVDFAPGFITDETQSATSTVSNATSCASLTACNGLEINGNSVKVLHVYTFNKAALPTDEQNPTVAYSPVIGNKIVRLVG